jgi:5-hydroxyisourate hydrolase-like protein (transthyretin family)
LSAWFISVAEAQALQGQAVPEAKVKAYIWSLNLDLSKPVSTTNTKSDGRYTLLLPPEAAGKDIVVIVEKQVQGGTIRLSAIVPDVPPEGKTGVDIDAATTLAAEQIAKFAKDNQISDLSSNGISAVIWEVRKFLENVPMLNLVVGALGSPLPQNFGDGLQGLLQETVQNIVQNQEGNLKPATGDVAVAKSIVQMLRDFGVSAKDLPETEANTINAALTEQQTVISSEIKIAQEFLDRINFPKRVLGFSNLSENPSVFSTTASGQATTEVEGYVYNDLEGRPIPNATVDAYIGSQKIATTKTDSSGRFAMQLRIAQTSVVTFVATSGNFVGAETRRINPGEEAWVYIDIPQSDLIGLPPGKYREIWTSDQWLPRILERIGDAPDNKTWIVEVAEAGNVSGTIRSRQESEKGLVLTVTVQNPIGIFRYTHEAGKYTFQVSKPNDATIQYDGSIAVTTDAQGNPTQIALNATVKDSKLSSPITFSGTLQGTPAQTGTVSGSNKSRPVNRSPVVARRQRGRQSQDNPYAPYTEAKFVNVSLQSQFGNASIGELKVVWMRDSLDDEKIKQISLTGLTVRSQTSKPASLTVSSVSVEFRETTQQEKQLSPDVEDLTPTKATVSATLEGSGIRLQVSNLQASEFKWVKVGERWDWWQWKYITVYLPIPTTLNGQVSYSSPTVQFNGSIDAKWENPQSDPKDFGGEDSPVALVEVPKGTVKLAGNWVPKIGRPAGIQVNFTSNPTGNAPQVQMNLTINYGDQKLSGTITGTLDIRGNQSYGFKSGNLDMTHTPSNFKVQVSWERGKPVSGKIVTAQGQKVADIGEAKSLGLPLGSALVVKYTDTDGKVTFETLESVLPRSRLGRK